VPEIHLIKYIEQLTLLPKSESIYAFLCSLTRAGHCYLTASSRCILPVIMKANRKARWNECVGDRTNLQDRPGDNLICLYACRVFSPVQGTGGVSVTSQNSADNFSASPLLLLPRCCCWHVRRVTNWTKQTWSENGRRQWRNQSTRAR